MTLVVKSNAHRSNDEPRRQHREFFAQIASPSRFEVLFDYLPDVYFFVKDRCGRFMQCNSAFASLVRARSEEEVLGLRDVDFFPSGLAENYVRDDHAVMASATPIIQKLELVRSAQGSINWHSTTKLPILDACGEVIGVAGVTRDFSQMKSAGEHLSYWAPVLEAIIDNHAEQLSMASLAAKVSLSVSQFERRFKKRFQTTPRKYLTNVRINQRGLSAALLHRPAHRGHRRADGLLRSEPPEQAIHQGEGRDPCAVSAQPRAAGGAPAARAPVTG
jgi:PAS domain S-box-containing protein